MHFTAEDLTGIERIKRLSIINSISGIRPANLIGTKSNKGTNLAIFNSVTHIGSSPPLLGFVLRPKDEVPRHTYENIISSGYYTVNHVHKSFSPQAHYTSAKFESGVSEFTSCGLSEEYLVGFEAPFVKESRVKLGMKFVEEIPIKLNNTILIIGEIMHLTIPDEIMDDQGQLDLEEAGSTGVSGLNTYYQITKVHKLPYARAHEVPRF